MSYNLNFTRYNEYSILIEWPSKIDEIILEDISNFKNSLKIELDKQKVEVITTYNTILVVYNFTIENINNTFFNLRTLYEQQNEANVLNSVTWEIPVCYDDEFAIDLDNLSRQKKLSKDDVIRLHSEKIYSVFFIGFLPGFLYLGGLNPLLHFNRKSTPSLNIKKGSVAIGGEQTGIYPQDSPGGWHIIGRTPIELFNPKQNPPCFVNSGDKVQFKPITMVEYLKIEDQVSNGFYKPNAK